MNNTKINEGLTILPVDLVKVNLPQDVNLYGTEELEDFIHLFYSAFEAYEKALADSRLELNDLLLLGNVVVNLISALNGANSALHEGLDLTDEEISELVNLSENFNLGDNSNRYRQIVKEALLKLQTISVFK
ncbi:MAG: hypothetical protein SCALA702_25710 [Melioribacteraceae bacterium]|nr:MAG: hypothetical protein SCALA702_25710 [Melioribacteraceae bacterium]